MAGRGNVNIWDISLIVKDIRKRQIFLANHNKDVPENPLLHMRSESDIQLHAEKIVDVLNLDMNRFRQYKNKNGAYRFLVDSVERANILVSRGQKGAMPQTVKDDVRFSGIAIRHKKFPAMFLYAKDESVVMDPAGRRIFTIMLLLVCMSLKRFLPVSYDSTFEKPIETREYMIAEEILMPRSALEGVTVGSMDDVCNLSNIFKVTPSMVLMRLKRLRAVNDRQFRLFFQELNARREIANTKEGKRFKINPTTKIVNYNGRRFVNDIIQLYRSGEITRIETRRLLGIYHRANTLVEQIEGAL